MSPQLARAGRALVGLVLLTALALAVHSQGHALRLAFDRISLLRLLAAFVALAAGLVLSMLSWRAVLTELGSPLGIRQAARIFFVGQVGKYLPGALWPLVTQAELGRRAGIARSRMLTAGLVALGMSVSTGLLVGLLGLGAFLDEGRVYAIALGVLLPLAALGLHPAVLNRVLAAGLRLTRRAPLERPLSARGIAVPVLLLLGCWTLFGLQAWLLVTDLGGDAQRSLPLAVGSFALASTLGLLFLIAPAGAGVREAVLVIGLAPVLSTGDATAVALLSRLLATLADGLAAGLALLAARRGRASGLRGRRTAE